MNLVVDIGNTRVKYAVYDSGGLLLDTRTEEGTDPDSLADFTARYPEIDSAILSSTRADTEPLRDWLAGNTDFFVEFTYRTPVPVRNDYLTPETLGLDRLAAAVAAAGMFPGEECLIADFGTAITIDRLSAAGTFLGGNISPGARTRFLALHRFTGRLPLLSLPEEVPEFGRTTSEALSAGVVRGIVNEMAGYVEEAVKKNPSVRVIFTGGDGDFFAKRLKYTIFVSAELVPDGLNRILQYNKRSEKVPGA